MTRFRAVGKARMKLMDILGVGILYKKNGLSNLIAKNVVWTAMLVNSIRSSHFPRFRVARHLTDRKHCRRHQNLQQNEVSYSNQVANFRSSN